MTAHLDHYRSLIADKRVAFEARGFTDIKDSEYHPMLFDHQRHGVEFALRAGCSALFYDTGLGKALMALAWGDTVVKRTNKSVLMLAPLAVAMQLNREAEKFGINSKLSRFGAPPSEPCIAITNYERLEKFDPDDYAGVILDECFAPDTMTDVVGKGGKIEQRKISEIQVGDLIRNASGTDTVSDVHRREVPYGIRVSYAGKKIICSPNHPFFTRRGWVGAQDLKPGDQIIGTNEAMRILQGNVRNHQLSASEKTILQSILLGEMADASTGNNSESSCARSRRKTRKKEIRMASIRRSQSTIRNAAHSITKSNVVSGSKAESLPPIESHSARTFRAWGQWSRDDLAAIASEGCTVRQLAGGICFVTGSTQTRISDTLQNRLGERRKANSYRSGWSLAPVKEAPRREKGCNAGLLRVDGVEVLELGHPDLDRYRNAEGKLYFYDLGGTRHPSFSVNGGLVHNSSILKNMQGATTKKMIATFNKTPYRLACTATPAPNDHSELGTHSEFLGALSQTQMLVRWFIHDSANTGTWRMKGHAVRDFWDWVASWARCVSKPSDLGFSDDGFILPELQTHKHIVEADRTVDAGEDRDGQGMLFRMPNTSATSIHTEKRLTREDRAAKVADLIGKEPDEPWVIWVDTDYDAEAVREAMPDVVEVSGKMKIDMKEERLDAFSRGEVKHLMTKTKIAGMGLNWQHCARQCFAGLSFSYESYYQAIRRSWRFGQTKPVHAHVVCADTEAAIWDVVSRKAGDHEQMKAEMSAAMKRAVKIQRELSEYNPNQEARLPAWLVA